MPKYIVSQPAITRCIESRSSRSPITTSAPMSRNNCARSSSLRTIARTSLPCFNSSSVTVRPTPPTRPAEPVTRIGVPMFVLLCEGFQFGHYSWQIFSNRGMNVHRALDHRVRRLRVHDVQQNVDDFIAANPENRRTQNLFCLSIHADLHESLCLAFLIRQAHLAHLC